MIRLIVFLLLVVGGISSSSSAEPIKVFILAGQSNMVGWGNSLELTDEMRTGNGRVLMFEQGRWQPLRPVKQATENQKKFGMTEKSFGPEIAFAHAIAEAQPDETIGIVKFAIGGTSILTWRPDWTKADADRMGQGRFGSLYQKLISKVREARQAREVEFAGFLWVQGGADMKKVAVAKEYLQHLKSLVEAVRAETGVSDLPFYCASPRRTQDPDDISDLVPDRVPGPYPAVEYVLKAQWDIQQALPHAKTVVLRDIETHPKNVHYNTAGQMKVGRLFADAFLETFSE